MPTVSYSLAAKLYPDAIRIPSARMDQGDKRAAGPRVPGDVWDFPRVVGNAKERQPWHPTQHPVALYDRVIKYSCGPGDYFSMVSDNQILDALAEELEAYRQEIQTDMLAICRQMH